MVPSGTWVSCFPTLGTCIDQTCQRVHVRWRAKHEDSDMLIFYNLHTYKTCVNVRIFEIPDELHNSQLLK